MADSDSPSTNRSLLLTKITTTISYLLLVITAFYYTFATPDSHNGTFWHHNHASPFAQSKIFTSIYWLILFALQLGYAWSLYSSNTAYVATAQDISVHYAASNLLLFGFIHLFVRSHYVLAEVLLVINFFNLSFLYFRHSTTPRFIHIGIVSGPLAWNFAALYWCGALAVTHNGWPARIVANVFIWGWAAYGAFFLVAYKDYTMGYAMSALSFCAYIPHPIHSKSPHYTNLLLTRNSNRCRTISHAPALLPVAVDFCLHDRRPLVPPLYRSGTSRTSWQGAVSPWSCC
jgi:hypothetical protein